MHVHSGAVPVHHVVSHDLWFCKLGINKELAHWYYMATIYTVLYHGGVMKKKKVIVKV